ncbi:MAG: epoxide hydrolase family protein [Gammaproteobacteria bacterium]
MPERYRIHVPREVLMDLRARLRNTRWPDQLDDTGWEYGTDTQYLKTLVAYWANEFDWRAQERKLNELQNYRASIDGLGIHFVHEKGVGPNAIPVLLLHGWPSTFVQFQKIIPLLTNPVGHGARGAPSFDVVAASLPGYGFSDIPADRGFAIQAIAGRLTKLMTDTLGYKRFGLRGSDIGGSVIQQLALAHPEAVIGVHVTGMLRGTPTPGPGAPSEEELWFNRAMAEWDATEIAYARIQGQKPQTLAVGLNDSPAGLASWIVEKFQKWGDTQGDVESRFSKDELLTNLTIYWATGTAPSSVRLYYEFAREQRLQGRVTVPTALLIATHDMVPPPREVSERMYNIVRWTQTDVGGHFLEWEEPQLVAEDMRAFFGSLPAP